MTFQETLQLVDALKNAGISTFKGHDIELSFQNTIAARGADLTDQVKKTVNSIPIDAPHPIPDEITHKIEELRSVLSLPDNDLVDVLFPEPKPPEDIDEAV